MPKATKTIKENKLLNSRSKIVEAMGFKNSSKNLKKKNYFISSAKKFETVIYNSKRNKYIRKKYSAERTTPAEKRLKGEVSSKTGHNSGKSFKKDKTTLSKNEEFISSSANYLVPCASYTFENESLAKENLKKNFINNLNNNVKSIEGITKKIIFVSLDFLEDCQKYKKKFRKQTVLKGSKLSQSSQKILNNTKRCLAKNQAACKTDSFSKEEKVKSSHKMTRSIEREKNTKNNFHAEEKYIKLAVPKKHNSDSSKKNTMLSIETELRTDVLNKTLEEEQWEKNPDLSFSLSKKILDESNISKIDEQYIKSLFLITNKQELIKSTKKEQQKTVPENQTQSKSKIKGKEFFEEKNRHKKLEKSKEETAIANKIKLLEISNENEESQLQSTSFKELKSKFHRSKIKLTRVLTQSEIEIKFRKTLSSKKGCFEDKEMKSEKNLAYSKMEIDDSRKKRKPRNNDLIGKKEKTPCEISRQVDVKELWRRVKRKESEYSFLSSSSSTVVESECNIDSKNLGMESYILLKKIVEEEINRISMKYASLEIEKNKKLPCKEIKEEEKKRKENLEEEKKDQDSKNFKENSENIGDFLKINETNTTSSDNFGDFLDKSDNELDFVVKRRILNQSKYLNLLNQNEEGDTCKANNKLKSEDLKDKLKILDQQNGKIEKIPSEIVKNWSILHRLEKAFLALGRPNFQTKNCKDSIEWLALKSKNEAYEKLEGKKSKKLEDRLVDLENRKQTIQSDFLKLSMKNFDVLDFKKPDGNFEKKYKQLHKKNGLWPKKNSEILVFSPKSQGETPSKNEPFYHSKKTESDVRQFSYKGKQPQNKCKKELELNYLKTDLIFLNSLKKNEAEDVNVKQKKEKLVCCQTNIINCNQKPSLKLFSKGKNTNKSGDYLTESKIGKKESKQSKFICKTNTENMLSVKYNEARNEKFGKKKSSRVLISTSTNSNKNDEENLERKRTFDVISRHSSCTVQTQKSKSCNEIDKNSDLELKNSSDLTREKESKVTHKENLNCWNFSEENQKLKAQHKTKNQILGKEQSDRSIASTKKVKEKTQIKEKINLSKKRIRASEKFNIEKGDFKSSQGTFLIKRKVSQDKKFEKKVFVEDLPQQIFYATNKLSKNNLSKRAVKERSILSMRGNKDDNQTHLKNFSQKKCSATITPILEPINQNDIAEQKDVSFLMRKNFHDSDVSFVSTKTYDIIEPTVQDINTDKQELKVNSKKTYNLDLAENIHSFSTMSKKALNFSAMKKIQGTNKHKTKKFQLPTWEQDIQCYRAIVKDIMNQYKRLDGLLKHSENFKGNFLLSDSLSEKNDAINNSLTSQQSINIHEYRKKIMSEYKALPIFEYKSKILEKKHKNEAEELNTKRNLLAVKALNTEMDLDVKDFHPNIQKVLDSQLYVDSEKFYKRNQFMLKEKEKIPSLEDIFLLNKDENLLEEEQTDRYQKTLSSPKMVAFLLKYSSMEISQKPNGQRISKVKNLFEDNDCLSKKDLSPKESKIF